jgi:hypothetical protein
VDDDLRAVVGGIPHEFRDLSNPLVTSLLELKLAKHRYITRLTSIKTAGSPDFDRSLDEVHALQLGNKVFVYELSDQELFLDFKIFVTLAKAALDRLIPGNSWRLIVACFAMEMQA